MLSEGSFTVFNNQNMLFKVVLDGLLDLTQIQYFLSSLFFFLHLHRHAVILREHFGKLFKTAMKDLTWKHRCSHLLNMSCLFSCFHSSLTCIRAERRGERLSPLCVFYDSQFRVWGEGCRRETHVGKFHVARPHFTFTQTQSSAGHTETH